MELKRLSAVFAVKTSDFGHKVLITGVSRVNGVSGKD